MPYVIKFEEIADFKPEIEIASATIDSSLIKKPVRKRLTMYVKLDNSEVVYTVHTKSLFNTLSKGETTKTDFGSIHNALEAYNELG